MSVVGQSDPTQPLPHSVLRTDAGPPPSHSEGISSLFRSDGLETDQHVVHRPGGFGRALGRVLGFLLVVVVVGGGAWAVAKYSGLFAGKVAEKYFTHTVARGNLVITVTEDGSLESAANVDIRCQVAGGGIIKKIVTDGTIVKEGDQLVELDSAAIDEQILQQKIGFEKARAVRDQAKNDLEAAKISLREYVEGTFKKERQLTDSQITIAEENLRSARNALIYTERMFRKAYVTPLQLEAQQFAVKRAQLELETAQTAKRVLEEFTFAKMKNDLETQVATAEAKASSEQTAYELEESKLKRLETQKTNTIISAPQSGMVVYANESGSSRGGSSDRPKIEEGATVRESQVILRVPDLSQMQVKATVHESRVESLKANMPASIRIQNRKLTGYVTAVANQPEPSNFFSSGVREYATLVRIDGEQRDLKPGMTAEVEILIDQRNNVLTVPVQCIVEQANKFYCWKLETDGSTTKTEVKLGPSDAKSIEVSDGLSEGDVVLQNPPEKSDAGFMPAATPGQFGEGPRGGRPNSGAPGEAGPGGGPSGKGGAGRSPGGGRSFDVMANDKDGDGKVSKAEAPAPLQALFSKLDTDGDGFITAQEAADAKARRSASGGGPAGGGEKPLGN